MIRVLFIGDLAPTGFGSVTTDLGRELLKLGLDLRFISQNDTGSDLVEPFRSRTVDMKSLVQHYNALGQMDENQPHGLLPSLFDGTVTADLLDGSSWAGWVPEACILLGDVWAVRLMVHRAREGFSGIPTFNYSPVEGVDLPPAYAVDPFSLVRPVAMSNFGADELAKVLPERPPMVYHGIDAEVFHPVGTHEPGSDLGWPVTIAPAHAEPVTLTSKRDCKVLWSNYFATPVPPIWMLRTDRHMPRKRYNAMLRSVTPVLYNHPDTLLILHCQQVDQGGNLPDSISKMPGARMVTGVSPNDNARPEGWSLFGRKHAQVILTNSSGMSRDALVSLYNAADLYLSTSAEGFGLTIAEALACGVPAVGLDYSAVPEVIGPAGKLVPIGGLYDNEYDHFWAVPDEQLYSLAVEELLTRPTHRERLGRAGPPHIRANFSWVTAAAAFADLIESAVAERIAA